MTSDRELTIRIELLKRGVKGAKIARDLNVSRQSVDRVIGGVMVSRRIRAAIAGAIEVPYEQLWGSGARETS